MRTALVAVGGVWLLGCVWSFTEQTAFAGSRGFTLPHLLPLVIDGFAVSMAGVAWAASLDARPAVAARLATLVAVAASSASNGTWAWLRAAHDVATVVLAVAVPVAANIAFEVLLAELRRQVQRRRGLAAPVAIPYPRSIRLLLAPGQTFRAWRALVLDLTAVAAALPTADDAAVSSARADGPIVPALAALAHPARPDRPGWAEAATPQPLAGDARVRELAALLERGHSLTGPQVGVRFGCSARTGRRLVAAAQTLATGSTAEPGARADPLALLRRSS
jgi:hypothetical protein